MIFGSILYFASLIRRAKKGEKFAKNLIKFLIVTLIINGVLLLLIWPGNWVNDEFSVYVNAVKLNYYSWQNYLTVIWYSVGIMLFHSPVGVVVLQTIFISFSFAYFMATLHEKVPSKWIYLLFFVLLLPPVVCNNFFPLRITMNVYLELLTLTWVYRKYSLRGDFSWIEAVAAGLVLFLLSFWRSEGIFYLAAPFVIWWFFRDRKMIGAKCVTMLGISLVLFLGFTKMDKMAGEDWQIQYKTTAIINPLSTMLTEDKVQDNSKDEIKTINESMDVELLRNEAQYWNILVYLENGERLYRDGYVENYNDLIGAFLGIVKKNPELFLKNRAKVFLISNGNYDESTYWWSINNLTKYDGDERSEIVEPWGMVPINIDLRRNILEFLEGVSWHGAWKFWNAIPIIIATVVSFIILIIRKKWLASILIFGLLLRTGIVFLTAPASFFMYYYAIYLEGLLFVAAIIAIFVYNRSKGRRHVKD